MGASERSDHGRPQQGVRSMDGEGQEHRHTADFVQLQGGGSARHAVTGTAQCGRSRAEADQRNGTEQLA